MTVNTSPTNSRVKEPPVNKEVITTSGERYMVKLHKDDAYYEDRNLIEGRTLYKKDGYYYFCEKQDHDAAIEAGVYGEFLFLSDSVVTEFKVNDLTTSQELRILQSVQSHLADAQFDLYGTRFSELSKMIDDAVVKAANEIIGAEDRRNERT